MRAMDCLPRKVDGWLLAGGLLLFSLGIVETWVSGYGWHEQQRILQLVLLVLILPGILWEPLASPGRLAGSLLLGMLVLGLLSSLLAVWPGWALRELAVFAGLVLLVLRVGAALRQPGIQRVVLAILLLIGSLNALQFLGFYAMAFITGIYMLEPWMLFTGFANPRFLGQFQALLLPLMAASVLLLRSHRPALAAILLAMLVVQWNIAWSLGGRGVLLALGAGHGAVLLLYGHRWWRLAVLQALAALCGLLLSALMFRLVPQWLGQEATASEVLRTGFSLRELLWQLSLDMAQAHPWLGVGPLHFAAHINELNAHPHQLFLQWLAEWGGVSTLLLLTLLLAGLWRMLGALRMAGRDELDAGLGVLLLSALVLAQVDGVIVMPFTQTWLAVLLGLAFARWGQGNFVSSGVLHFLRVLAVVLALGMVALLWHDVPGLPQRQENFLHEHGLAWAPRFWAQGWIPMP